MTTAATRLVSFTVNGEPVGCAVEPRLTLLDCLRDELGLYGTRVGCEHGVCGCCNVMVDGTLVRSCLMLAQQAEGAEVRTIEGVEGPGGELDPVQQAFCDHHALQCGYCTPGMIMTIEALLAENPRPSETEIVDAIAGNLCRCTGYQQIIDAAKAVVAARLHPPADERTT
jgi:aerobic-type carbon monoxide dehydrogenase small subunit (CoxS/CutS family)